MNYYTLKEGNFTDEMPPEYYKFKYQADHFQLHGFKAINAMENILVTAHTGAGKTSLALYAIAMHLMKGNNVIYTSPIKTLSNQKFKEFSEDFDDVGIMTGDVKINPSGKLMIMTAEILRNAIMRKDNKNDDIYDWSFDSDSIKLVVLDEVHFINNKDRGMVWEDIITNLDPSIQLVMLSATINGADKLAKWVGNIKQKMCHHIPTPFRPVPLKHYVFWNNDLHLMLEGDYGWKNGVWNDVCKDIKLVVKNKKLKTGKFYLEKLITHLKNNDMLPANIFLLNKKLVEKTAMNINMSFIDNIERSQINKIWDSYLIQYKPIYGSSQQWNMLKSLVEKGIGIHHSGIIPILKEIVEILYSMKLVKILIATETFAMGVNMPTKTTIFTNLTKYDGNGKRMLNTEEYIQMAGRAGRRGLDSFGTVVILPEKYPEGEREMKMMMTGSSRPLQSRINFDYHYILKQMLNYENSMTDITLTEYIIKNINSSYFGTELKNSKKITEKELEDVEKNISNLNYNVDDYNIYKEYIEIENKLSSRKDSWITLDKKTIKKLTKKQNELKLKINDKMKNLSIVHNIMMKREGIIREINFSEESIILQFDELMKFLKDYNFIDIDNNLTVYGKIMSHVNECNPIILGYIIKNKILSDLSFEEIVGLLSIFIDDSSIDSINIDDLNISESVKNKMYLIGDLVDEYMTYEVDLNNKLPYKITSDWYLHTNIFSAIVEWSKGKNWTEISSLYPTFEGNFIKNVLRLSNLIKNVYQIAQEVKDVELINKLEGFEEKLIRDFVTTDSLYL